MVYLLIILYAVDLAGYYLISRRIDSFWKRNGNISTWIKDGSKRGKILSEYKRLPLAQLISIASSLIFALVSYILAEFIPGIMALFLCLNQYYHYRRAKDIKDKAEALVQDALDIETKASKNPA